MAAADQRVETPSTDRAPLRDIGGRQVSLGLQSALAYLEANQDVVNDLNVFPVPDGDTGSNMYLTLRSAVEDATHATEPGSAAAVLAAAAHGSLMGARGNSGVILSQILRGLSTGAAGRARLDPRGLADALVEAREVAYKAVMKPTEGTVLTVIREAAEAAEAAAEQPGSDIRSVLEATVASAHAAVERTPEMLAVLRDAGVVDAGGFGLAVILEGFARPLQAEAADDEVDSRHSGVIEPPVLRPGEPAPAAGRPARSAAIEVDGRPEERRGAAAVAPREGGWGYCTEFLVNGPGLDVDGLRDELGSLGESSMVVGDPELVRVHIHTLDPARLIAAAAQRGRLTKLKVEDMTQQHHDVLDRAAGEGNGAAAPDPPAGAAAGPRRPPRGRSAASPESVPPKLLGVVTVAPGEGFRDILTGIGADEVVEGGQTMNPSTEELLAAVRAVRASTVIILPNNKNVILTAQQVDSLVDEIEVRVVPSRTLPQGIAALLALDPGGAVDENCARMLDSLAGVTTVEVTRAVRDTVANGKEIHSGDVIALVDDEIAEVGADLGAVVEAAVAQAKRPPELITVYRGAGVSADEAGALASAIGERHPQVEVEVHEGGQEHYPYILSLE